MTTEAETGHRARNAATTRNRNWQGADFPRACGGNVALPALQFQSSETDYGHLASGLSELLLLQATTFVVMLHCYRRLI